MLKLSDIMSNHVVTIAPESTVQHAVSQMLNENVGSLMVATEDGRLVGMVTESDLIPSIYDSQMRHDPVSLHMDRKIITVSPEMTVDEAINQFVLHRVRGLPVVDRGKILGIVRRRDVLRASCDSDPPKSGVKLPSMRPMIG